MLRASGTIVGANNEVAYRIRRSNAAITRRLTTDERVAATNTSLLQWACRYTRCAATADANPYATGPTHSASLCWARPAAIAKACVTCADGIEPHCPCGRNGR